MEAIYRKVTPQEAYELQSMFPDVQVDYTQFKVYSDNYTQSTKTSCDTLSDTRCDFYIPQKATLIKSWQIEADVELIDLQGQTIAPTVADAADALAKCQTLDSAPSCIERFYILHGNGAGDILHEITNHAHALFKMRMQGLNDASEYGYFIVDSDIYDGGVTQVVQANPNLAHSRIDYADVLGNTLANGAANSKLPVDILGEYTQQVIKVQKERHKKFQMFGRRVDDVDMGSAGCVFLSSDLLPTKINYWPHMLSSRGITIRCDLRSDNYHLVPRQSFTPLTFEDNKAGTDIPDV